MKVIHYSRTGYNGDYTYTSVCGKNVKTHQDNEESSIYSSEANCKKCLKTSAYKTDLKDSSLTPNDVKIRIYI